MKFKDKDGNVFIPTSSTMIEAMKTSKDYEELKETQKEEQKEIKKK